MFKKKVFNKEINDQIIRMDMKHASPQEKKPLYIKRNCFDVTEDCEIYRIFELRYLLNDIRDSKFSLVSPLLYKDRYENPLYNRVFISRDTGEGVTLNGIVENLYVSPWTIDPEEKPLYYPLYAEENLGMRVKSTVGKVMDAMMNLDNPGHMLQFHSGAVDYYEKVEIDKWIAMSDLNEFLDSLGHLSVQSLMALRNKFSAEKEVRFVFTHFPHDQDNEFISEHVSIKKGICNHPIDWLSVIDEVVLDPRISADEFETAEQRLRSYGLTCDISNSSCRQI